MMRGESVQEDYPLGYHNFYLPILAGISTETSSLPCQNVINTDWSMLAYSLTFDSPGPNASRNLSAVNLASEGAARYTLIQT